MAPLSAKRIFPRKFRGSLWKFREKNGGAKKKIVTITPSFDQSGRKFNLATFRSNSEKTIKISNKEEQGFSCLMILFPTSCNPELIFWNPRFVDNTLKQAAIMYVFLTYTDMRHILLVRRNCHTTIRRAISFQRRLAFMAKTDTMM